MKNIFNIIIILIFFTAPVHAERFFGTHNTWYEKLDQDHFDNNKITDSAKYTKSLNHGTLAIMSSSGNEWLVPIYYSQGTEDVITVNYLGDNEDESIPQKVIDREAQGWHQIRIPAGARPAGNETGCDRSTSRDGHFTIINPDRTIAWEFYKARHCVDWPGSNSWCIEAGVPDACCTDLNTGTCTGSSTAADDADPTSGFWWAKNLTQHDLTGTGVYQPWDWSPYVVSATRAALIPQFSGIVTYGDVQSGVIDHAMVFAYPGNLFNSHCTGDDTAERGGKDYFPPCCSGVGTGTCEASVTSRGVYPSSMIDCVGCGLKGYFIQDTPDNLELTYQVGMRYQLDPSFDCTSISESTPELESFVEIVCVALQDYGMIYMDNDGTTYVKMLMENLYDDPYGDGRDWSDFGIGSIVSLSSIPRIGSGATVTSPEGPFTTIPPILSISQPDGVSDSVVVGNPYSITYSLSDSDSVVTAEFYYDTDTDMAGGIAVPHPCSAAPEGTDQTCSWDTSGVTPGDYYIYGVTDDGTTEVKALSPGVATITSGVVQASESNVSGNFSRN